MKLFDKAFDKMVAASKPVQDLADAVRVLAEKTNELAQHVAALSHNQAVHNNLIAQMWNVQQAIYTKLQASALDTKMPSLEGDSSKKSNKAN